MRSTFALTALLFLAAADPGQPLLGHWTGTSICTAVRPACHDEIASYYVKPGSSQDAVTVDACKVVDGKDESMGTIDFHVDFATHVLSGFVGDNNPATFTWSGDTMTGTFKQHDGQVIRNIRLTKQVK
ncbi:MAG TPA: hypothetical protein VGQ65_21800 [Thermoanaerobaculia bacterium]|jgi:hypothetical protein|nr:hypothetical protein [Thermoanaerobaculia bacterium]